MKTTILIALANEESRDGQIGLENEFALGADGWVRIAPYGDSIKERESRQADGSVRAERFLQRLTRPAAEAMARQANSLWGKIKRFRVGVPIFRRHPDLATHSPNTVAMANNRDTAERVPTEHGVFADIEAREDGLYGRPVLTAAGREAIENDGLKWLSPFWWTKKIGEEKGIPVMEPVELISAGLTDRPNIAGGEALANQAGNHETHETHEKENQRVMKEHLIKILALLGVALANEADDAAIEAGVKQAMDSAKAKADAELALANEKSSLAENVVKLTTDLAARETTINDLQGTKTALENERASLVEKLKGERQARIALMVDQAAAAGRITPAERPGWETALANEAEFDAKAAELAAAKPKMKTVSAVGDIGKRKGESNRQATTAERIVALANERMKDFGGDWDKAYASVRKSHPALFEAKAAE